MSTMAEDLIFILEKDNAELARRNTSALRALSEPRERDAALNLMGVLEDMREEGADPVVVRTLNRVLDQILEAQRALQGMTP